MNRREFLMSVGAVAVVGCTTVKGGSGCADKPQRNVKFRLGVAGFTYYKFKLDETLADLKRFGVHELCAKQFHYPMDAKPDELKALLKKTADAGVNLYGVGPVLFKTEDDARKAFDYAAALGVPTLVAVPVEPFTNEKGQASVRSSRKMCELCSRLADEYGIDVAIHNHGMNPKTGNPNMYPTAVATDKLIHDLSPRMGYCLDIAYTYADGFDPAEIIRRFAPRIFDVHLRNVALKDNGSSALSAEDGPIDYVRVFRALKDIGYDRVCGLELAYAFEEPAAHCPGADPSWMPRSLGYFRGLMDAI